MEFESRQDIAAPIEAVFAALTDFPAFERQVLRRGGEVRRLDQPAVHGPGATWDLVFQFRGRDRQLRLEVVELDPPHALRLEGVSQGMSFEASMDLLALSRQQTRLTMTTNVTARSMPARLLLQSLKLARGPVNRRFEARIEQFARDIELRHARSMPPRR